MSHLPANHFNPFKLNYTATIWAYPLNEEGGTRSAANSSTLRRLTDENNCAETISYSSIIGKPFLKTDGGQEITSLIFNDALSQAKRHAQNNLTITPEQLFRFDVHIESNLSKPDKSSSPRKANKIFAVQFSEPYDSSKANKYKYELSVLKSKTAGLISTHFLMEISYISEEERRLDVLKDQIAQMAQTYNNHQQYGRYATKISAGPHGG